MVKKVPQKNFSSEVNYRAVCKTDGCNFTGHLWSNSEKAYEEAMEHIKEPGCSNHIVKVIEEQTENF